MSTTSTKALAADRSRVAEIEAQILELKNAIRSLREEGDLIRRRLNAYTYPVLTLPNEIVSEIFVHFLPVYPKFPPPIGLLSPYLLCQICRKWRNIALATPVLWSAISLSLRGRIGRLKPKHLLLDNSLRLSASCPLSIKLNSVPYYNSKVAPFVQAITDHCARWGHLELLIWNPLDILPIKDRPLPSLRSLKLGRGEFATDTTTFLAAPLLQKVSLEIYYNFHRSILPWSQLTVLSVDWLSADQYTDLLPRLANIIYCDFTIYNYQFKNQQSLRDVTLPYLETFILDAYPRDVAWNIFDTVTLPSLRRLQFTENLLPAVSLDTLASFVLKSGCSIQELCIPGSGMSYHSCLDALPSVTSFLVAYDDKLDVTELFLQKFDDEEIRESFSDEEESDSDEELDTDTDSDAGDTDD